MDTFFKDKRIFFVYSSGDSLNDEFAYGLDIINFEEALFRHFEKLGYKRILFYNGVDGLYSYKEGMLKTTKKRRIEGIIKKRTEEKPKLQRQMIESEMLNFLESFMKKEKKGVFVITDFFSLLNNLSNEELKELNQIILDIKQLSVENESILIFLEPSSLSINKIKEKLASYRNLENLIHDIIESDDNLINIQKPYDDEVRNLLNYLRIKNSINTNFLELENISKDITKYIREKELNLRDIHKKLLNVKKIDSNAINKALDLKPQKSGWDKFDELVGVDEVKEQIREIVNWVKSQQKNETTFEGDIKRFAKINEKHFKTHLNIALKGNPGTGKTTIAKIIGEIFKEENILPYGQFINASRSDLVAGYVGQTAIKTAEMIEKAKGGVLFIDEAYSLIQGDSENNHDFGKEAIDELVKKLSDLEGEISCIIAGYENDIDSLLETNDGLKRRFLKEIVLRDYRADELKEIFLRMVKKNSLKLDKELENILDEFFDRAVKSGFTKKYNAAFSINFFNSLMQHKKSEILTIDDIGEEFRKFLPTKYQNINIDKEIFKEIDSLIGLDNIKEEMNRLIASILAAKKRGELFQVKYYAFLGNPGTGKTTVAKLFGKIFRETGLLKGKFLLVSEAELTDSRVGETPKKVKKILDKAKGGVLFIDEAYTLLNSNSGKQVIDTLVNELENRRGEFCLILAGYKNEMENLFKVNPGLSSRIDKKLIFEDYNEDELFEIFLNFATSNGFKLTQKAKSKLKEVIKEMIKNKLEHFGNAREMRKLFEKVKENLDFRIMKEKNIKSKDLYTIIEKDFENI